MHIPGVLTVFEPHPADAVPVLADSPHSGRDYPADFLKKIERTFYTRCEDRYVDQLIAGFPAHGATVVTAHVPRTFIDLNRARDDVHMGILSDAWTGSPLKPSEYSSNHIGLIWDQIDRRDLYPEGITSAEVQARIQHFYDPYYQTLRERAALLKARFGRFYHLNMHSMPVSVKADIVLGNRFGQSCSPEFTSVVENAFFEAGVSRVVHNKPYAGAELTRIFAGTQNNGESLQIEINRGLYLDGLDPHPVRFAQVQDVLNHVVKKIGDYAAASKIAPYDARSALSRSAMDTRAPSAASDVTP